jgi:excinuclease ABC subunit C
MENDILSFLRGNDDIVIKKLEAEMYLESSKMNYEKAKELKEMLDYIKVTMAKQKVEINDITDRDIFGYYTDKGYISITVLFIRGGKILERHSKIMPMIDEVEEEFNTYLAKFYEKDIIMPKEILGPSITDYKLLEEYFGVSVKVPLKGTKKNLVDMASDNAKVSLTEKFEMIKKDEAKTSDANEELRSILNLEILDRIELFDNSNLFGSYNVSGMVVFADGKPSKNDYRKFKISIDKNDDYGTMREVIYRRYYRVLVDGVKKPDLIIVDGGLGQINIAREVINSLGLNIPVVGLKKDNKHTTESLLAFDPIIEIKIDKKSNVFYYLERMQDEVHNFTINYHKQLRSKGSLESILDSIDGIGSKRRDELLKKYKTITKLKELSKEELEKILPSKIADNLIRFLNNY